LALIGVLCEVVTTVADSEEEAEAVKLMKDSILVLLRNLDEDNSGEISREEMRVVFQDQEALSAVAIESINRKIWSGLKER